MELHHTYTIHRMEGAKSVRLDGIALRQRFGIESMTFVNARSAALFAQKHANGAAEAILRVYSEGGQYLGDHPIPPLDRSPPVDEGEAAFMEWFQSVRYPKK